MNASGRGMLVADGSAGAPGAGRLVTSLWSPDGTFSAAVPFAPASLGSPYGTPHLFMPYAADHVVAGGRVNDAKGRAWVGTGRMGKRLDAVVLVPQIFRVVGVDTAANPDGDLATIAVGCATSATCARHRRLVLSIRRSGHPWRAFVIDSGYLRNQVAVATNHRGDVLIAYAKRDSKARTHVYGRIRTLGGRWESRHDLGYGDYADNLVAALGRVRRAVVIWTRQSVSECEPGPVNAVYAAAADLGGRWNQGRRLARWGSPGCGHYVAPPGVAAAFSYDSRRRALIAWTARSPVAGAVFSVHYAVVTNGVIYSDQVVSDPAVSAVLSGLDMTPAGQATIAMTTNKAGADPVFAPNASTPVGEHILAASTTSPLRPFRPLQDVSKNPAGQWIERASVAIDPVSTRALAAWSPLSTGATIVTSVRAPVRRP